MYGDSADGPFAVYGDVIDGNGIFTIPSDRFLDFRYDASLVKTADSSTDICLKISGCGTIPRTVRTEKGFALRKDRHLFGVYLGELSGQGNSGRYLLVRYLGSEGGTETGYSVDVLKHDMMGEIQRRTDALF